MARLSWSRVLLVVLVLALAGSWTTALATVDRTDVGSHKVGDTNWGH